MTIQRFTSQNGMQVSVRNTLESRLPLWLFNLPPEFRQPIIIFETKDRAVAFKTKLLLQLESSKLIQLSFAEFSDLLKFQCEKITRKEAQWVQWGWDDNGVPQHAMECVEIQSFRLNVLSFLKAVNRISPLIAPTDVAVIKIDHSLRIQSNIILDEIECMSFINTALENLGNPTHLIVCSKNQKLADHCANLYVIPNIMVLPLNSLFTV